MSERATNETALTITAFIFFMTLQLFNLSLDVLAQGKRPTKTRTSSGLLVSETVQANIAIKNLGTSYKTVLCSTENLELSNGKLIATTFVTDTVTIESNSSARFIYPSDFNSVVKGSGFVPETSDNGVKWKCQSAATTIAYGTIDIRRDRLRINQSFTSEGVYALVTPSIVLGVWDKFLNFPDETRATFTIKGPNSETWSAQQPDISGWDYVRFPEDFVGKLVQGKYTWTCYVLGKPRLTNSFEYLSDSNQIRITTEAKWL
jgi:hypothetical protein